MAMADEMELGGMQEEACMLELVTDCWLRTQFQRNGLVSTVTGGICDFSANTRPQRNIVSSSTKTGQ